MLRLRLSLSCVFAVLAMAACACADELSLTYTLSFERPETGIASVRLEVSGLRSQGLRLLRPTAYAEGTFDSIRADNSVGKTLTVAPTEGGFYVTSDGSPRLSVNYTVSTRAVGTYGHVGLICGDYAALDGSMVFLLPEEAHTISSVELRFSAPANWRCVTGWKKYRDGWTADAALAPLRLQMQRSLFCFGDFRRLSKTAGTNTLNCWALSSYPEEERVKLADALGRIYSQVQVLLDLDTGGEYHAVCLPEAGDGLPVIAGAWSDGVALTLAGKFQKEQALLYIQYFSRFLVSGYFAEQPFGVRLSDEDWWFYPALFRYTESLGLRTLERMDENTFYGILYTNYIREASLDNSETDMPLYPAPPAASRAAAFLREEKAPLVAMHLDYQMREATGGAENLETLARALFNRGRSGEPVRILDVLRELTGVDFTPFYDEFVLRRSLILPVWPSFIEQIKNEAAKGPGPVAATVDGVPIYQTEVELLAASAPEKEGRMSEDECYAAALALLIDEKLLDKALAKRRIEVVPEIFWQLRTSLPPKILRVLMTRKRQVLKELLFDEWQAGERKETTVEIPQAGSSPTTGR